MPKTYASSLEVRGYELDGFGHVNHAVYVSYLEHARWELLRQESIGLDEFKRWGKWPVIARVEADYLKPTFLGDRLTITTLLRARGRADFVAEQEISREGVAVFRGKVRVVVVNERGKPASLPEEVGRLLHPAAPGDEPSRAEASR